MGDHAISNETIYPTTNDVAATAGNGRRNLESNLEEMWEQLSAENFVVSGLTVPASDADLNIDVALGVAMISGHRINVPGATSVTAANNDENFLYLKLARDGNGNVTSASFEVNVTGSAPSDSVLLALLVASGGAITFTADLRPIAAQAPSHTHHSLIGTTVEIWEDFEANPAVAAPYSEVVKFKYGWFFSSATTMVAGDNNGGKIRLNGDGATGPRLSLGNTLDIVTAAKNPRFICRWAQFGGVAGTRFIGLSATLLSDVDPSNGIYFRHALSSNIIAVARSGGVESTLDTGVAAASGTYHVGELRVLAGGTIILVYIDGVFKGVLTSNIPSAGMAPGAGSNTNANAGLDIDYFYLKATR